MEMERSLLAPHPRGAAGLASLPRTLRGTATEQRASLKVGTLVRKPRPGTLRTSPPQQGSASLSKVSFDPTAVTSCGGLTGLPLLLSIAGLNPTGCIPSAILNEYLESPSPLLAPLRSHLLL